MPESLLRSFFGLFYEELGSLLIGAVLRALPWALAIGLFFALPAGGTSLTRIWVPAGLGLAAFLVAPYLAGGIYLHCAALARDAAPGAWRQGMGRRYRPLLAWGLIQALLGAAIAWNLGHFLTLGPQARGFAEYLALGAGFWLWVLARLFSFRFLPCLLVLDRPLPETLRLTLLTLLSRPGQTLAHFLQRQLVALVLALTGVGLIFGAASLLPLHACLCARLALRAEGLDLSPPGEEQPEIPLPSGQGIRSLWRPWE